MIKLFDEIPRLEGETLVLGRIRSEDLDALRELTEDDAVYRWLPTFLFERQFEDLEEMLRQLYGSFFRSKESLILGIYRKEGMLFCGLAEFYGFKDALHKTCIGYRLLRRCWGQGIATEAVALMAEYLFSRTDIEIITASTMVDNIASARVLEKNGFTKTASAVSEDWGYCEPTAADKWFR